MGKQRGCMAVGAESQIDEIELWHRRGLVKALPNVFFISSGRSGRRIDFRRNAVDVSRGNWNVPQQSLGSHPVIAVGIIGTDIALVSPKEVHVLPINAMLESVAGE